MKSMFLLSTSWGDKHGLHYITAPPKCSLGVTFLSSKFHPQLFHLLGVLLTFCLSLSEFLLPSSSQVSPLLPSPETSIPVYRQLIGSLVCVPSVLYYPSSEHFSCLICKNMSIYTSPGENAFSFMRP